MNIDRCRTAPLIVTRPRYPITDYPPPLSQCMASLTFNRCLTTGVKNPTYPESGSTVHPPSVVTCRRWSTITTQLNLRETTVRKRLWPGSVSPKSHWTHIIFEQRLSSNSQPSQTASTCGCSLINALTVCHLFHTFVNQMGVLHYSRLRVGCHPRASSLPADNMGS